MSDIVVLLISSSPFFSFGDGGMPRRLLGVERDVMRPLRGHLILMEYRVHWTFRLARLAVNTLIRFDIKHRLPLAETIAWTNRHAVGEFATYTGLGHYESHEFLLYIGAIRSFQVHALRVEKRTFARKYLLEFTE